jgi:hypothetical protein
MRNRRTRGLVAANALLLACILGAGSGSWSALQGAEIFNKDCCKCSVEGWNWCCDNCCLFHEDCPNGSEDCHMQPCD